ncbi:MAG: hypothetical protein ACHREM_16775 [Polyangiales bacterium]
MARTHALAFFLLLTAVASCKKHGDDVHVLADSQAADPRTAAVTVMTSTARDTGTCVWTLRAPVRGVSEVCRDDGKRTDCVARDGDLSASFNVDRKCPDVGFACLGNTWDASFRRTNADGTCPAGSSRY